MRVAHTEVLGGAKVSLAVAVDIGAGPCRYQWRKGGADLPGATGATLEIPRASAADAGVYAVSISDAAGACVERVALTLGVVDRFFTPE